LLRYFLQIQILISLFNTLMLTLFYEASLEEGSIKRLT
jgi:hypothetical protein